MLNVDISTLGDGLTSGRLIRFEGSPQDRRNAFVIDPDGWGGDDAPAVRRESIARPGQHGSFSFRGYRDARVIPVSGAIVAESPEKLQHMRNLLAGVLADGLAGRMTVQRPLGEVWIDVMLAGTPTVKVRGRSECEAIFQVQFWSPLPWYYGQVREFEAGQSAVHAGNVSATPRLLVGAGAGGYTVTGPAGRVVTVGTAPAAAHYIDFTSGGLFTAAGVRQFGAVTVYQPWEIPPGLPGVSASITGARTLAQQVTDTFI